MQQQAFSYIIESKNNLELLRTFLKCFCLYLIVLILVFLNLLNLWDYVMTDSNLVLKLFWNISMIWQEVIQILRKMPTHLIITINVILAPYTLYQMSSNVYAFQYFSTFMETLMLIIHLKSGVMKVSCKVHTHMNTHIHTCNFFPS